MKIVVISAVWCPSCLIMRPRFEKVAEQYPDIKYEAYDIDLDENASLYNVGHILPTFILLDDKGVELERLIGEQKIETLQKVIEEHALMEA